MALRTKQRTSAVLILALLLMGAIIGSGIALSTVIADSAHQSQTLNDFIGASLNADSGIERGLATVKVGRQAGTIATTLTAIGTPGTPNTAIPNASVSSVSPSTAALGWSVVRPNESVTFDIGKKSSNPLVTDFTITIQGQKVDVTYTNNGPQQIIVGRTLLDVTWLGLDANGEPFYSGRTVLTTAQVTAGSAVDLLSPTNLFDINGQKLSTNILLTNTQGFRVRIKAVDQADYTAATISSPTELAKVNLDIDSVKQLRVTGTAQFPSRIEITSTGTTNKSRSQKAASVLWQLPSTPAFGYVLFTEGDIIPQS